MSNLFDASPELKGMISAWCDSLDQQSIGLDDSEARERVAILAAERTLRLPPESRDNWMNLMIIGSLSIAKEIQKQSPELRPEIFDE